MNSTCLTTLLALHLLVAMVSLEKVSEQATIKPRLWTTCAYWFLVRAKVKAAQPVPLHFTVELTVVYPPPSLKQQLQ